jgi:secondary thiamine-phosphate synthase enzyme
MVAGAKSRDFGMIYTERLSVRTEGRGTQEITELIKAVVVNSGVDSGLCSIFIHHTSASLVICENADPQVRKDLDAFLARLVPDGDPIFKHTAEGPDDMPAHVRSVLTPTSVSIPVVHGQCDLGTWQGIFVWEHRARGDRRKLTVSVVS